MIEILLPVYNGEKYLVEQINSIINQTYQNWVLKIRNDGSEDDSQSIINDFCKRYPDKVIQIKSPLENVGLVESINILIKAEPHKDYVAFSDQDDVWLPNKLEKTIERVKYLEKGNTNIPIGVCTDAICVDERLSVLKPSFFSSQKFPSNILGNAHKMLALNIVQGSTMIVNKVGIEKSFPIPKHLNVHDAWVAMIINHYGFIEYMHWQSILYRQHSNNVLGEINVGLKYYLGRIKKVFSTLRLIKYFKDSLPFKTHIIPILYYKLYFGIMRICKTRL